MIDETLLATAYLTGRRMTPEQMKDARERNTETWRDALEVARGLLPAPSEDQ